MQRILFYNADLSWISHAYFASQGGYAYRSTQQILGTLHELGESWDVIELAFHSGVPGQITLVDSGGNEGFTAVNSTGTVTQGPGMEVFWHEIGRTLKQPGTLSLNACEVGAGQAGFNLLRHLHGLVGGPRRVCGAVEPTTSEVFEYNNRTKFNSYP